MIKRIIGFTYFVFLMTCAAVTGVIAYADGSAAQSGNIPEISDEEFFFEGASGSASYDSDTHTLTLDSFVYRGEWIYACTEELNIHLVGDSVIESISGYGIFATGDINVTADEGASLEVSAASALGIGNSSVAIHANGHISLLSGEIIATGGDYVGRSIGISSYSSISVGGARVSAHGGEAESFSAGVYISGTQMDSPIGASAELAVEAGSLMAFASGAELSTGVCTDGELSVLGGELILCGEAAVDAYSVDFSEYFMPSVQVGEDSSSTAEWSGEPLADYGYISVSRAVTVTVVGSEYGEIIASTRHADIGEHISIEVNPISGYAVERISVVDARGNEVALNNGSFIMPDAAVTVSADFAPLPAELPLISVSASSLSAEYGYSDGEARISVDVSLTGGTSVSGYRFAYQWYDVTDGTAREVHGAVSDELSLPVGAEIGTYRYFCRVRAERRDNGLYKVADSSEISFTVTKKMVEMPEPDTEARVYNGSTQVYSIAPSELYTVAGNERAHAGEYTVTVSLCDKERYCWSDGYSTDLEYSFIIARAKATIALDTSELVITLGEDFTLPVATSSFGVVIRDMDESDITEVGQYTVTYTALETNDYIGDTKTLTVTVNPADEGEEDKLPEDVPDGDVTPPDGGSDGEALPPSDDTDIEDVLDGNGGGEFDGESDNIPESGPSEGVDGTVDESTDGENESVITLDGRYTAVIFIVASVVICGVAVAVTVLIIIKRNRESAWREYSEDSRHRPD